MTDEGEMGMRCGDCRHYEPARNPETNRPLPSQDGHCVYPVTWPKLPKAFLPGPWTSFGCVRRMQFPQRRPMWKDNAEPCEVFEARVTKTKEAAHMTFDGTELLLTGAQRP